jgi:hypothetical protein
MAPFPERSESFPERTYLVPFPFPFLRNGNGNDSNGMGSAVVESVGGGALRFLLWVHC